MVLWFLPHPTPYLLLCFAPGVFSMDGDIAPLADIVRLAKKYGAYTFVGECVMHQGRHVM
jgi:hypothetical protein